MVPELDVFTIDEIARAAGVPREAIQRLVDTGRLRPVAGTAFFDTPSAVHAGRQGRLDAASIAEELLPSSRGGSTPQQGQRFSTLASSLVHMGVLAVLIWGTSGAVEMAATTPRDRLVFVAGPGPGGGGGGGGRAMRAPVNRIQRPRPDSD